MTNSPIIEFKQVCIQTKLTNPKKELVKNSSFVVFPNEIVAIVGESGSGKSITSLALMGLLPQKELEVSQGDILFENKNIISFSSEMMRSIRGKEIGMIFQEPMSALNPSMRCGEQVSEIIKVHFPTLSNNKIKTRVLELFEQVKLPLPLLTYAKYPHELSGGQKQRIVIAIAIACEPKVLIADEPTTALDVTVQREVISLLKELQMRNKMSVVFISHDLNLVSTIADRVIVMYQGNIVEQGCTTEIFTSPKDFYTKALLHSRPSVEKRLKRLPTVSDFVENAVNDEVISVDERSRKHQIMYSQEPILSIRSLCKQYSSKRGLFKKHIFNALSDVTFDVYPGETVGLVGESGCGKTTLGNTILMLDKASSGQIVYKGQDITTFNSKKMRLLRKEIQIIFQDPYSSLNPKMTVGDAIMEPMIVYGIGKDYTQRRAKVLDILKDVGLKSEDYMKFPHEFSGGQRQRIGIARCIALEPSLIICDESVSALDISVQAQVLNLLNELKEKKGFTYIFISHDLAVVKYMSDQVIVMNKGCIEEITQADDLFTDPKKDYTKRLVQSLYS